MFLLSLYLCAYFFFCDFLLEHDFLKASCMTRLLQTHSWLQTSNGWKEEFDPPPILQQNMVDVTMNNNTISFPIFCQSAQHSHPVGIFNGDNPLALSFSLIMFNLILNTLITHSLQVLLKPLKQPVIIYQIIVSRFLHLVITFIHHIVNIRVILCPFVTLINIKLYIYITRS